MKKIKISTLLLLICLCISSTAQKKDELSSVDQLVSEIGNLNAEDLTQSASRSRLEACALSVRFGYPTDNPPGEEVMLFLLSSLNENDIDIEYNSDNEEWDLSVYCNDLERHVRVVDQDLGDSYEMLLMVSDKNKAVLEELKQTLIAAIRDCKARE